MEHLHILARLATGEIAGVMAKLTPERTVFLLDQGGYPSDDQISSVVSGGLKRGYHVEPNCWVAVFRCQGENDDACASGAMNVTVGGDIRMGKASGVL